jgi:hypothetical protein
MRNFRHATAGGAEEFVQSFAEIGSSIFLQAVRGMPRGGGQIGARESKRIGGECKPNQTSISQIHFALTHKKAALRYRSGS